MYCSQCGKEILDNSKYCFFCSSPIVENINQEEKELLDNTAAYRREMANNFKTTFSVDVVANYDGINQPHKSKSEVTKAIDVPMPKKWIVVLLIVATIFWFVLAIPILIVVIQESFYPSLLWLIIPFLLLGCTSSYIKDYKLARDNFPEYQAKELRKRAEEISRKEDEQKRQMEHEKRRKEYLETGIPTCAKCGSHAIATINRGYSIVWGLIGSGKPVNVCQVCGHKWQIGR